MIFAILLCWQMPHFLSLAWMYRKDYERAGFAMWTVGDDSGSVTSRLTVAFSVLMVLSSIAPWLLNLSGLLYVSGAGVLGSWFVTLSLKFAFDRSVVNARMVLKGSIWYIPILLFLIVIDRLVML